MKISTLLSTNPARFDALPFKGNFDENVAAIKAMGFDGIELAVRDPRIIDQEKVVESIKETGLDIPALGTGQAWGEEKISFSDPSVREAAVERVYSHVLIAERTGAIIMNIEEPSIEESIRKAGDRIFHFHYADSNRWYPGAGHLDFSSIIRALADVNYNGYVSGEHRPDPNPGQAARLGLEKIRSLIGEFK